MTWLKQLVQIVKEWLAEADINIDKCKLKETAFTRNRKIKGEELLLYILTNAPGSISENLVDLYEQLEVNVADVPTKQALSQKRKLIDETPFKDLFRDLVEFIYRKEALPGLKTYKGLFAIGIDGTDVNTPNNPKLKEELGTVGRGRSSCAAKGSVAFDLLNKFSLDAQIDTFKTGERKLAERHFQRVSSILPAKRVLYIMDRGYFSKDLFKKVIDSGSKFLCRCPNGTCHAIDDAPTEGLVELENGVVVKVFKVQLTSGEWETLVTNVCDMNEIEAYELYDLRWGIEENYKIVKNHLHLECFNGCTKNVVFQEFYAVMVNSIVLSALAKAADKKIRQKKGNKYKYQANRNRCEKALRSNLVQILVAKDEGEIERLYENMLAHSLRDTVPIRKGRKFARKKARATRYHFNYRY